MSGSSNKTGAQTWPKFTDFISADWIEGTTFRRFRRLDMSKPLPENPDHGDTIQMVVLTPKDKQISGKCDNCFRKHQSSNINCSMTMGRKRSFLDNNEFLFDFKTQEKLKGIWIVSDIETMGHSALIIETRQFKKY